MVGRHRSDSSRLLDYLDRVIFALAVSQASQLSHHDRLVATPQLHERQLCRTSLQRVWAAKRSNPQAEPTSDQWRRRGAWTTADITLMFAQEGERQMGALVEAGACFGAGKRLYLVTPHAWSFQHHPRVRNFKTIEQAVAAIAAAA